VRIALCVPRASHLKPGASGDRVFVAGLLAGLRGRGHDVEIVSRLNVRDVWRGRVGVLRLARELLRVTRAMRRFSPDAWLVYGVSATNPDLFGWWQRPRRYVLFAASAGKARRVPRRWRRVFMFAYRRSLAHADKVVPAHPQVNLDGTVPRERVIPLIGIAATPWEELPSRAQARRLLGLPEDACVVLCLARFTLGEDGSTDKTSMVLDLIHAVDSLDDDDVILVVAGDGPGRERLEAAAAERPPGRVRILRALEHDQVARLYAACTVFAYPMRRDWPWMVVLEAQACGRPVVTMRTRSGELTVDDGRTGLLAADPDEFRSHLAALVADPQRCEAMGEAAHAYIARTHSIDVRLEQIEALLRGEA
jgi:glycosyltransferase involved in cell wall biosynthesis